MTEKGFLPLYLIWDSTYQRMRMAIPWYATRNAFFYDMPQFKVFCVPCPLFVRVTPGNVVGHLSEAGNAFAVIDLLLRWTVKPEADYTVDFRLLFAARGAWLATVHGAK